LPFEDLKGLGPNLFPHSQARHVTLEYYPIRREADVISDVVVVATDKTTEHQAQMDLEIERQYAAMIVKFIKNKEQFSQFLRSVDVTLNSLLDLAGSLLDEAQTAESFRLLHTLEGEAGIFSLRELRQLSRDCQQVLEPFKSSNASGIPVISQAYKSALQNMRSQFQRFLRENNEVFQLTKTTAGRSVELPLATLQAFAAEMQTANVRPALVRRYNELFFKVTVESRLRYFDGLTQNVAERLGKRVKPLHIEGGDIRIFPEPYQKFFSCLVHAFRNAVDHGLEDPTEREWAGKDPAGQISVKIQAADGRFTFAIADDGKGIDPKVIRQKLKDKFPDRDFSGQSDEEVIQNICLPGFSSRETLGEFSGRGVGMDAMREEILSLGGSLRIISKINAGTTIVVGIPDLDSENGVLRSA
jgi:two-component system chemotaxis sensor kinase CheA